jgi:hypothetical protein
VHCRTGTQCDISLGKEGSAAASGTWLGRTSAFVSLDDVVKGALSSLDGHPRQESWEEDVQAEVCAQN